MHIVLGFAGMRHFWIIVHFTPKVKLLLEVLNILQIMVKMY